jgi:hypothetical protein
MKLKSLLEGYAWERKADGSLPTLADAMETHKTNMKQNIQEAPRKDRGNYSVLDLVSEAEDMVQNLRSNMATNSVLQREEKMGYLEAFNELLDILGDIGYQAEFEG